MLVFFIVNNGKRIFELKSFKFLSWSENWLFWFLMKTFLNCIALLWS